MVDEARFDLAKAAMGEERNFYTSAEEMFSLYEQARYADALVVIERLAEEFPEQKSTTAFWEICLLCCSERPADALSFMSQAMDGGLWWSEQQLRGDNDLAPLQGQPEFEKMVLRCKECQDAAQGSQSPELHVFEPEPKPAGLLPLLIVLHGRGSSASLEEYFWNPAAREGWLLAMPQSSQLSSPGAYVWDDAEKTETEIVAHFAEIARKYPINAERVILAGFSQGAARAIHLSLKGAIRVQGFLAVVPGVRLDGLESMIHAAKDRRLRGYLVAGGKDPRHEIFRTAYRLFNENGIACRMEEHPDLGHEFPKDFHQSITNATKFIFEEE